MVELRLSLIEIRNISQKFRPSSPQSTLCQEGRSPSALGGQKKVVTGMKT
jgi:hypothetical protein